MKKYFCDKCKKELSEYGLHDISVRKWVSNGWLTQGIGEYCKNCVEVITGLTVEGECNDG